MYAMNSQSSFCPHIIINPPSTGRHSSVAEPTAGVGGSHAQHDMEEGEESAGQEKIHPFCQVRLLMRMTPQVCYQQVIIQYLPANSHLGPRVPPINHQPVAEHHRHHDPAEAWLGCSLPARLNGIQQLAQAVKDLPTTKQHCCCA